MDKARSILIRALITLSAIVLVAYNVEFPRFAAALGATNAAEFPALALLTIASWLLKCWRLQTLFPRHERVSVRACSQALGMGVLGNLILPLRAGDLLRCAVLKHLAPATSVHGIITTFAMEKLLEAIAIAAILICWASLLVLPQDVGAASDRVIIGAVLAVAALFAAWALHSRAEMLLARMSVSSSLPGKIAQRTLALFGDVRKFFSWRRIAAAGLQTALLRLVDAMAFLLLAWAVGIPLTLSQAFLVMGLIAIATALPAAPGYLGTYEAAGVIALSLFGTGKAEALAYALVSHAWFIATWLVFGLLSAVSLPLPMRKILNPSLTVAGTQTPAPPPPGES